MACDRPPVSVKKSFLGTQLHPFVYLSVAAVPSTVAQLSSRDRDCTTLNALTVSL